MGAKKNPYQSSKTFKALIDQVNNSDYINDFCVSYVNFMPAPYSKPVGSTTVNRTGVVWWNTQKHLIARFHWLICNQYYN